jgi:hypothetical protein
MTVQFIINIIGQHSTISQPPKAKSNQLALGGGGGGHQFYYINGCYMFWRQNVKISTLLKVEINIIKNIYFISHN